MKTLYLLDDDKNKTFAGDTVRFNYGIPPVKVDAQIIERDNKLIALTPGHTPNECNLRSLRRYVGNWYKVNLNIETRIEKAKALGWKKICSRRFPGTIPSSDNGPIILYFGFEPKTNIWKEIP